MYSGDQDNPIATVRHGLDLFIGVIKKHAFYPEGNPTLEQSFLAFREWLADYLAQHETLHVDVEKNRLLHQGETVQEERPGERPVIFPLFRDGIVWIEFLAGVGDDELWGFIRLVNQYREPGEESENDLVTALWEADFANIGHKAVDTFWEAEALVGISSLKVNGPGGAAAGNGDGRLFAPTATGVGPETGRMSRTGSGTGAGDGGPGADRPGEPGGHEAEADDDGTDFAGHGAGNGKIEASRDPAIRAFAAQLEAAQTALAGSDAAAAGLETTNRLWQLTSGEEAVLNDLIAREEERDAITDCLDILLILIREKLDGADRVLVRDFVAGELRDLFAQGDFAHARAFVEELSVVMGDGRSRSARLAQEILAGIAGVGILGVLNQMWPRLRLMPDEALEDLRRLLLLLPAEAVDILVPMVARAGERRLKAILMEALTRLAARSRADIAPAISAMPAECLCELLGGFAARNEAPPAGLLKKLTRHRDPLVRIAAAKALVDHNPKSLKTVFHLIRDPDQRVGRWLLSEMGRKRNPLAERLLLAHLAGESENDESRDEKFVLECYHALGRCASKASVAFLRDILMKRSWGALFGVERSPHRTGAAMALHMMPAKWGAKEALSDAENSRLAGIRRAHTEARRNTRRLKRREADA